MAAVSKAQRKKILSDPIAAWKKQKPDIADENLDALGQLHQQYMEINTQLKDSLLQRKKVSRQIGEAKREARSSEDLVQAMRQLSGETDQLQLKLDEISGKILQSFEPSIKSNGHDDTAEPQQVLPPGRIYADLSPSIDQVSIKLLNGEHKKWNHYVDSNPASSLYHRAEWKELIQDVFGHECFYYYATLDEDVVGILPLVRLNSRLFGDFMVSMPYFNSGGAIADSLLIEQALMQEANRRAEKIGSDHIEYRDDISRDDLPVRDEKVNMLLSLPDTQDALWRSFNSKLRSQIKRAQRENTVVDIGGADYLDDFYIVFAKNMRDLGTPVYGKKFFHAILQRFREHSVIVVVRLNGKPVAAAFLLGHKDTLEIPWASTIKQVNHLSLNMLLYWEILKFAIKNKYRYFDFGRSSKDSGTYRFKQQWGAQPKQCYWHYWLQSNAELPSLNPNNPKYKLLINLWKKIPVSVTKHIGPNIVKNLP